MIAYFKERNSFQVPALLFLTLLLKLVFVNHPHYDAVSQPGGLLSAWLTRSVIPHINLSFASAVCQAILFASALSANYLLRSGRMFSKNNMLVALCVLLFTSLFPGASQISPAILLLPLTVLMYRQVTLLYNQAKPRPVIINLGMLAGLGYILYHPFIWLLPFCFAALAGMRPFKLTEWLLLLAGIITPAYFLLSYEFFTDQLNISKHIVHWSYYTTVPVISRYAWMGTGATIIWVIAAVPNWQGQMRRMLIQSRKNWYQLIAMGVFILPMIVMPTGNASEGITLLAFPAASFASNAFTGERGVFPLLLFWLIVIAAAVAGWAYIQ